MRPAKLIRSLAVLVPAAMIAGSFAISCASTQTSLCDPVTIEHNGRCFWSKEEACDAASCPPAQCEIIEGKPAHIQCHKPAE